MTGNVVETKVILDKESVHEIVMEETAKMLLGVPDLMKTFVKEVLFHRPPKRNSYDKEIETFYESVIRKTLKPMIEAEVVKIAEEQREVLSAIIRKAFKAEIINNSEFENRMIKKLGDFASNISFYVSE